MAKTLTRRLMDLLSDGGVHTVDELAKATGNTPERVLTTLRTIARHRTLSSDPWEGRDDWAWTDLDATDRQTQRVREEQAAPKPPELPKAGTQRRRVLDALAAAGRPMHASELEVPGVAREQVSIALSDLFRSDLCHRDGESGKRSGPGYRYWPAIEVPGFDAVVVEGDAGTPDVPDGTPDVPAAEDDGTTDDPQATIAGLTRERDAARAEVDDLTLETRRLHAVHADFTEREHGLRKRLRVAADALASAGMLSPAEGPGLPRAGSVAEGIDRMRRKLDEAQLVSVELRRIAEAARIESDDGLPSEDEIVERIAVWRESETAWHRTCEAIERDAPGREIDIDDPDDLVALWSALDRLSQRLRADLTLRPASDLVMVLSQYAGGRSA